MFLSSSSTLDRRVYHTQRAIVLVMKEGLCTPKEPSNLSVSYDRYYYAIVLVMNEGLCTPKEPSNLSVSSAIFNWKYLKLWQRIIEKDLGECVFFALV